MNTELYFQLYWAAFEKCVDSSMLISFMFNVSSRFRRYPPITTVAENEKFCDFTTTLLSEQLRGLCIYLCCFFTDIMTVHRSFQNYLWAYLYLLPISAPISWILLCDVCLYPGYLGEF